MSVLIPLVILYVLAGICIFIMKKIQPNNKEYILYVVWMNAYVKWKDIAEAMTAETGIEFHIRSDDEELRC